MLNSTAASCCRRKALKVWYKVLDHTSRDQHIPQQDTTPQAPSYKRPTATHIDNQVFLPVVKPHLPHPMHPSLQPTTKPHALVQKPGALWQLQFVHVTHQHRCTHVMTQNRRPTQETPNTGHPVSSNAQPRLRVRKGGSISRSESVCGKMCCCATGPIQAKNVHVQQTLITVPAAAATAPAPATAVHLD